MKNIKLLKTSLLSTLVLPFVFAAAMANVIDTDTISKIHIEGGDTKVALSNNQFSELAQQSLINTLSHRVEQNLPIEIFGKSQSWEPVQGSTDGTHLLRFSVSANQFTKGTLKVSGVEHSSLYLNKELVKGEHEYKLELLNQDYTVLLLVSGIETWDDLSIEWIDGTADVDFAKDEDNKRASMKQYYDSEAVGSLNLSPDGELLVWSKQSYSSLGGDTPETLVEIIDIDSEQVVYRWQAMSPGQITWADDSESLVFVHNNALYQLGRENWVLNKLSEQIKGIRGIHYLSENELLISLNKAEEKEHDFTKRYRALQDRWNYWRGETQLQLFDIHSGLFKQLTDDALPSSLHDIDKENRQALITRSPIKYDKPPHGVSQLFLLDLDSGEESQIGEFTTFNSAHFYEGGYLISAGPNFADGSGSVVSESAIANDYDGQIYFMDKQGNVTPLSKGFSPAISQVELLNNQDLLLLTTDQDKRLLYYYDASKSEFKQVETELEVVTGFSVSKQSKASIVYKGSSATYPQKVYARVLNRSKAKTLFDSAAQDFAKVEFIDLKDFDYTTKAGQFIDGRVYYPSGFDENKQYPAIIYYYAGTLPVSRAFTGRWPFSLWASMGYVVYVMQPSGTTGYGQEFSARHVNAWGINTADEIIESTEAFVAAHPFVDKNRLGNAGASYGGFMTMYLATKTDMFAASISHAGISNLTSYWGHGWWGFGYSGVATRGNFPWNAADFYTQQSPVFAADKISTPLLLIHGDADTNVPVGESHQMYTALKLLGQDVELVEFLGDDHHINSRERRMRWWKTILAYFDMKLKDEPLWWETLYPEPDSK